MKVMVFDVPAESGGALSVLKEFYDSVRNHHDKSITWYFVLSVPELVETENVKVLRFPWIKKSWFHRYFFDRLVASKLVEKYKIDKVFSLQNLIIPNVKQKQSIYLHNSLPFVSYRYKFLENKYLWVYQNVIGRSMINSIKMADFVIVQTQWMKQACIEKSTVNKDKVTVVTPFVNLEHNGFFEPNDSSMQTFFYPASGADFKNHKIIIKACMRLKEQGIHNYQVIFTLTGNEDKRVQSLYQRAKELDLPIDFVGFLTREQVFDFYNKSVLLFPSYIETFGLPILEGRISKTVIIASDCNFSHEILDGYENSYFFNPFNDEQLAFIMKDLIQNKKYVPVTTANIRSNTNSWVTVIEMILN
jgi:glycosyltransferase involved in cell wall biosynthesis